LGNLTFSGRETSRVSTYKPVWRRSPLISLLSLSLANSSLGNVHPHTQQPVTGTAVTLQTLLLSYIEHSTEPCLGRRCWWERRDLFEDNLCKLTRLGGTERPYRLISSIPLDIMPQWKHSRHLFREDICQDIDRVCLSLGGGGCSQQNLKQSDLGGRKGGNPPLSIPLGKTVILPYLTSLMKSVSKLFSKFFPW
jgi:hypothetical protein